MLDAIHTKLPLQNRMAHFFKEFGISHTASGFQSLFSEINHYESTLKCPVVIGMEGLNGYARPLDQLIQQKGYTLYNINNLKLARFKELFSGPAKTDAIDALKDCRVHADCSFFPGE